MPTPEELERQVRRRPLGRTFVDICLDLAVVPGFCTSPFWNGMFEIMHYFGGNVRTLMREKIRRAEAFAQQPESSPVSNWDWRDLRREVIRQVLGFFIGEEPVDPFAQSLASCPAATGPP
jgi:hypothetical protein